jgi:hypothetical protein
MTLGQQLADIVRKMIYHVDYYATYAAKVVQQRADGSLDLIFDHPRIPAMQRVAIRYPFPGASLKVAAGARVLVSFEDGSPAKPYAFAWQSPGLEEVQIGGSRPIARQSDTVVTPVPAGTMLTLQAVGSIPVNIGQAQVMPGTPMQLMVTIGPSLTGSIITGSGVAKA